jgi:N-acetylmuramoyl-L-alanine amidase
MTEVVIEPGHGGRDPGAVGRVLTEAAVVGRVAQELAARFSGPDVVYILKRRNFFEGLTNKLKLDALLKWIRRRRDRIVLSLHCDSSPGEHHFAQVLWWAQDPDSRREELSRQLAGLLVNELMRQSVATSAHSLSCPYDRDGEPFTPGVLINTARDAAVLIEYGFLSDRHVEDRMATPEWVQCAALATDRAVREFLGANQ